jgi:hypothetical protein
MPNSPPYPQNRLPAFLVLPGDHQLVGNIPGLAAQTDLTLGIDLLTPNRTAS